MYEVALWNVNFRCNDFGDQRNNIFGGVLFSGGFCGDVSPFTLDVFFKRGDFRVVINASSG